MHHGWYITGDIAMVDTDGFIHITARLSRFSKIGGEMVPHIRIEEAIEQVLGGEESGQVNVVVTSIPDERKGEKLVVLHVPLSKTPTEICQALSTVGLPNLWIPDADHFVQVEAIPVLGSGKIDLVAVSNMAKAHFGK
jgi:acyl-[acyl-carrier-protein]-phospholipid O-acyltransferase/long-chain-fatty-acid--[acyl-carrier-protein] ligase